MMPLLSNLSQNDISVLSGRLSAPNAPPKSAAEAAAHLLLIKEQQKHERKLVAKEAKEVRRRREELQMDLKQWEGILPAFESMREKKTTVQLWRKGLPPQIRAKVWELSLGNPHGIDRRLYDICVAKARRRAEPTTESTGTSAPTATSKTSESNSPSSGSSFPAATAAVGSSSSSAANNARGDDAYSQMLGITTSGRVPAEVSLRHAFSREAYKLQRRYTNDHLVEGALLALAGSQRDMDEAALALGTLSEDGATLKEDNTDDDDGRGAIASPRTHLKDNATAIAIDLHRTIITSSKGSAGGGLAFTTIEGSSGGGKGAMNSCTANEGASSSPNHNSVSTSHLNASEAREAQEARSCSPCHNNTHNNSFGYGYGDLVGGRGTPTAERGGASSSTIGATPQSSTPMCQSVNELPSRSASDAVVGTDGQFTHTTPPSNETLSQAAPPSSSPAAAGTYTKALLVLNMCQDANLLHRISELLRTFVEYRPDIGYVQGMSYLAAMLLIQMESDEKAFVALASLLSKGHLHYFYTVQHRGIGSHMAVFEAVLQKGLPLIHRHFQLIGVVPQMYVIDWWMSLFSRTLPYEIAARCWDLFLLDEAYLYRISLSLLIYFDNVIHEEAPIDEILMFLSKIQHYTISEDRLFAIVADTSKYPPTLDVIHKAMGEHLKGLSLE